ncbi:MAG: GNAT family N-acetyltransferase [Pseudorhodoplanes sp.]|nr:GNAT family N-acetyltransferase [Pseudorhodoplanes sp.]
MTTLRAYRASDEEATIALWQRTWQKTYPQIAFAERVEWWRARWRDDLVPVADIVLAERDGALAGFVTIDRKTGYLDQLAVAPEAWGSGVGKLLLDEAKRLSPGGITLHVNKDNERAIRIYEKSGFAITGEDINPHSGMPVHRMEWRP